MDETNREIYCDNSIWNIDHQAEMTGKTIEKRRINFDSADSIAFGQVFIRKYGLYVTYEYDTFVLGTHIAHYRTLPGEPIPTWIYYKIGASILLGLAGAAVIVLTRMRIKRL